MARIISYKIVAKENFVRVANKVKASGMRLKSTFKKLSAEARNVEKNWAKMGGTLKSVGMKMSLLSAGVVAFGVAAISSAAKNESLLTSFKAISGSAEVGTKLLKDLYTFAAKTPFEIEGLGQASKMLLATGTSADKIIDTMGTLGDIASVSGGDIQGLSRIWAQIGSMGSLETERANQLADRGIDIFGALATRYKVDVPTIRKALEKRLISAEVAQDVLRNMTKKGGVAFNAMALESATVAGKWSNIKDTMSQTMMVIGDVLIKHLDIKGLLDKFGAGLESLKVTVLSFTENNPGLTKALLIFIGIFAILGPILILVGSIMAGWAGLAAMATAIGIGVGALVATIGLIAVVIAGVVAAIVILIMYWDDFTYGFKTSWGWIKDAIKTAGDFYGGFIKKGLEMIGVVDANSTNNTNIDVNLAGPKGSVEGVSSSSTGSPNINIGVNMAGAT